MFDSLPYRNDAAVLFRRLARSLPLRRGVSSQSTGTTRPSENGDIQGNGPIDSTGGKRARTSFRPDLSEDVAVAGRSNGYMKGEGGLVFNAPTLPYRGSSAGGGYSTAGDLLNFSEALQGGNEHEGEDGRQGDGEEGGEFDAVEG